MHFWGSETLPSTAISFKLTREKAASKDKQGKKADAQSEAKGLKATELSGYFTIDDNEEIDIQLKVKCINATYEKIDSLESSGRRVKGN